MENYFYIGNISPYHRYQNNPSILNEKSIKMNFERDKSYLGSTYQEVRDKVFSDPYSCLPELPLDPIKTSRFFKKFKNLLYRAAQRTTKQEGDILPYFDKLIHSNGIGYSGTWNITEDNPYSGLFTPGTKALMVARASCILTEMNKGDRRGFGFAGKIWPTMNPEEKMKTANFLLLHSFVGTKDRYFSDVEISNNPFIGVGFNLITYATVLMVTMASFPWADKKLTYRSLIQMARVGVEDPKDIKAPTWMMVKARPDRKQDFKDFRKEILVENRESGKFILDVSVTEVPKDQKDRKWKKIGYVELNESIASVSTDHHLHFHHLKIRGTGIQNLPSGI